MRKMFWFLILLLLPIIKNFSQPIASFEVKLKEESNGLSIPVTASITGVSIPDTTLILHQVIGDKRIPVPFQQVDNQTISWVIYEENTQNGIYKFELVPGLPGLSKQVTVIDDEGALTISSNDKNYLRYYYTTVYPPEGIDTAYKKSGFIHPLWSPHGQILTRIQPPDHYHHYGIWNPWTHVLFEGDTVDFWNIGDKKGTVRAAKIESVKNGAVFSEFSALQEHVVFKKDGTEKIAMNELFKVKVYPPDNNQDYYIVDIKSELSCASESPVLLLEYRYGGLGWRTTEKWDRNNSEVITSEGKTRKEADGSLARWCIVQGEIDNDYAGVVMMSHPDNYNHPEPLRIWPENQYERGDMFANFSPTKNKDWRLEPGKKYLLKYRLLVYNGKMNKEKADIAWQYYAKPAGVKASKQ